MSRRTAQPPMRAQRQPPPEGAELLRSSEEESWSSWVSDENSCVQGKGREGQEGVAGRRGERGRRVRV